MVSKENSSKTPLRKILFKALKATVKALLFFILFYVCWYFLAPVAGLIPGLQQSVEIFVAVYITFIVISELTAGTIYQHFFGVAKALFLVSYLALSLNTGILRMTYEGVSLMVDLRLFIMVAMLLGLLGLGKSVLQAINFLSQKAEHIQI
jgi:hypothetical protein